MPCPTVVSVCVHMPAPNPVCVFHALRVIFAGTISMTRITAQSFCLLLGWLSFAFSNVSARSKFGLSRKAGNQNCHFLGRDLEPPPRGAPWELLTQVNHCEELQALSKSPRPTHPPTQKYIAQPQYYQIVHLSPEPQPIHIYIL